MGSTTDAWACAWLLACGAVLAGGTSRPPEALKSARVALVPATAKSPIIDGLIGDSEWPPSGEQGSFVTVATLWERAAKQTTVRLCRTTGSLHVAFECEDDASEEPGHVRDGNAWRNGMAELLIQTPVGIREKWWFHVAVDPMGRVWLAQENAVPEMPGTFKRDRIKGHSISSAVQAGKGGWTAEMTIPLSDLEADADAWDSDWRANFCRTAAGDNAKSCWSMTRVFRDPERFGRLTPSDVTAAAKSAACYADALAEYQAERVRSSEELQSPVPAYRFAYGFNFGPEGRCQQEGYRQVDATCAYSVERGYGWIGGTAGRAGLVAQTVEDLGDQRDTKAMPAGALASSWVAAAAPAGANGRVSHTFRVDVPDGEYKVHLLSGLLAKETAQQRRTFTVRCGGEKVTEIDIGHYMFARLYFRCHATRGRLEFTFDGPARIKPDPATIDLDPNGMRKNYVPGWLVNTLVVYPVGDRKAAERQIFRDELSLTHLPPEELSRLEELEHPVDTDVAEPTAAESRRGFVVFERPLGRRLYPESRPRRAEIRESLRLRVTPGEPAYYSFGLLPLTDLDAVNVTPSALHGPGGGVPAEDIRVREAQFRPWLAYGSSQYSTEPVFLDDYRHLDPDMNAGECRWFWLSFTTPEKLAPGDYEGIVTIASRGGEAQQLHLILEVMPFRTVDVPFSYGGYFPGGWGMPGPIYYDRWGQAASDVGMNTLALSVHSYVEANRDFLRNQIRLFVRNGLRGPFVINSLYPDDVNQALLRGEIRALPEEIVRGQVATARTLLEWMTRDNFPELIYTTMDEAHCKGEPYWTEQVRLFTAVKKAVPEVLTAATESDRSYWRIKDVLDVPLLFEVQDFRSWRLSPEDASRGRAIWSYPNQAMLGPADFDAGRFCTGWLPVVTGLRGIVPWQIYGTCDYSEGFLKNGLRGNYWFMFMPRPVGGYRIEPRLTTVMGHIGMWDLRYAETLRSLIDEAENAGSEEARAIAAEMTLLLERIDATTKGSYMPYFESGYWKPEAFATLRGRVTDGIVKLTNALGVRGRP